MNVLGDVDQERELQLIQAEQALGLGAQAQNQQAAQADQSTSAGLAARVASRRVIRMKTARSCLWACGNGALWGPGFHMSIARRGRHA